MLGKKQTETKKREMTFLVSIYIISGFNDVSNLKKSYFENFYI